MTFEINHMFAEARLEQLVSLMVAGALLGYIFVAKVSAHLSPWEFGYRGFIVGAVFLGGMMISRFLAGSSRYEAWIGVMIAWVCYTIGIVLGLIVYDRVLKRAIEQELGHPLKYSPRGLVRPSKRRRP